MHYKIWSNSFLLSLGFVPGVYPLLLKLTSKEEDIHQEQTLEKEEMNLTISCNALARITTPQTIKLEGHIKAILQ